MNRLNVMNRLDMIKAQDEEWAMVHNGWPRRNPGEYVGSDRHLLLELLSEKCLTQVLRLHFDQDDAAAFARTMRTKFGEMLDDM